MHALDEVLANKEAADGESWTGTYPPFNVGLVSIVQWQCDWGFL